MVLFQAHLDRHSEFGIHILVNFRGAYRSTLVIAEEGAAHEIISEVPSSLEPVELGILVGVDSLPQSIELRPLLGAQISECEDCKGDVVLGQFSSNDLQLIGSFLNSGANKQQNSLPGSVVGPVLQSQDADVERLYYRFALR